MSVAYLPRDWKILKANLSAKDISIIREIMEAYNRGEIDFEEDEGEYFLIINDESYKETDFELLVLRWLEDRVETETLIEIMKG